MFILNYTDTLHKYLHKLYIKFNIISIVNYSEIAIFTPKAINNPPNTLLNIF